MVSKNRELSAVIDRDEIQREAVGRQSLTCPDEIRVDLEDPIPDKKSSDAASERGELMSSSFFDEEEAVHSEMGQRKWEDFIAMQEHERRQP